MLNAFQTCIIPLILLASAGFYSLGYTVQQNNILAHGTPEISAPDLAPIAEIPDPIPLPPPVPDPPVIRLAFVGDLLMHVPIGNSVYDSTSGSYNFEPVFRPVAPFLQSADFTVGNLETRFAGANHGYHGFPRFNTPADLAPFLKNAGFDLLATANNHCLDYGYDGIVSTLDTLDSAGLSHIGNYRTSDEKALPFIADIAGIKIAFLNYTERTNGITISSEYSYAYNPLYPAAVFADATLARDSGADFVVVILHFGNEYQRTPSTYQIDTSRQLCEGGVDAVIGAHPHVVQPVEFLDIVRDGIPHTCLVAYSLGNFISCQRERYRDCGIILYLDIEKTESETGAATAIINAEYLPVWIQRSYTGGHSRWRVLPAHPDITPDSDLTLTSSDISRISQVQEDMRIRLESEENNIRLLNTELNNVLP